MLRVWGKCSPFVKEHFPHGTWKDFPVSKDDPGTSENLSANLTRLLEKHGLSDRALAKKAGIDHKSVGSMREKRHRTNIDHVDAVAKVFALTGWQLLRPTLDIADAPPAADVDKLIELFYKAPARHRQTIIDVAGSSPAEGHPTDARDGTAKKEPRSIRR